MPIGDAENLLFECLLGSMKSAEVTPVYNKENNFEKDDYSLTI